MIFVYVWLMFHVHKMLATKNFKFNYYEAVLGCLVANVKVPHHFQSTKVLNGNV